MTSVLVDTFTITCQSPLPILMPKTRKLSIVSQGFVLKMVAACASFVFEFSESTERRKAVPACFARISSFRTMTEVDAASQSNPFGAGLDSERLRLVCNLRRPGHGCFFGVSLEGAERVTNALANKHGRKHVRFVACLSVRGLPLRCDGRVLLCGDGHAFPLSTTYLSCSAAMSRRLLVWLAIH